MAKVQERDYVESDLTAVKIDFSGSGDNTLVAAAGAGIKIKVIKFHLSVASATALTWKSGSTALTGAMTMSSGEVCPNDDYPWLVTSANEALVLNSDTAVQVSGNLWYVAEA